MTLTPSQLARLSLVVQQVACLRERGWDQAAALRTVEERASGPSRELCRAALADLERDEGEWRTDLDDPRQLVQFALASPDALGAPELENIAEQLKKAARTLRRGWAVRSIGATVAVLAAVVSVTGWSITQALLPIWQMGNTMLPVPTQLALDVGGLVTVVCAFVAFVAVLRAAGWLGQMSLRLGPAFHAATRLRMVGAAAQAGIPVTNLLGAARESSTPTDEYGHWMRSPSLGLSDLERKLGVSLLERRELPHALASLAELIEAEPQAAAETRAVLWSVPMVLLALALGGVWILAVFLPVFTATQGIS